MSIDIPARTGLAAASFTLWHKHMRKFLGNGEELFGLMIQPVLWILLFGVGMRTMVGGAPGAVDGDYIGFMLPGIVALSAMGGAIGGGMVWVDERARGIVREYVVAPIPRSAIMLGNISSATTKALFQALVIFAVGLLMGAGVTANPLGWVLGFGLLVGYAAGFAAIALAIASLTDDLMAYHAMIMLLNLPVLFLSNALYPLASMPGWMKVGALINPTSYLVDGMRQAVLGGTAEIPMWICVSVIAGFAALGLLTATRAFTRKTTRS
ncbi:MAG: ABC transporter permease [Maritimibacter sp.]